MMSRKKIELNQHDDGEGTADAGDDYDDDGDDELAVDDDGNEAACGDADDVDDCDHVQWMSDRRLRQACH